MTEFRKGVAYSALLVGMLLATGSSSAARDQHSTVQTPAEPCADDNGGITLPAGFCATVRVVQSLWAHFAMFCMTPSDREQYRCVHRRSVERTRMNKLRTGGFATVNVGGVDPSIRIEVGGDLHEYGGLNGKLLTVAEAEALSGVLINRRVVMNPISGYWLKSVIMAACCLAVATGERAVGQVLQGEAAIGSWRDDKPGVRRLLTPQDLR
jgi:hypothetical protein